MAARRLDHRMIVAPRPTSYLVAGLLMLALFACAGDAMEEGRGGERAANGESFRLITELGHEGDPVTFGAIIPGAFVDAETLVVGELMGSRLIRIALQDGGVQRVDILAGEGEGPGEFQQLREIGVWPDGTLWATDRRSGRATLLDERGQVQATATVTDFFFEPPVRPVGATSVLADSSLLVTPDRPQAMWMLTDTLFKQPLIRVGWDGGWVDTLFAPPPAHLGLDFYVADVWDSPFHTSRVLRENPLTSVSPDGRLVGVVHRSHGLSREVGGTIYLLDVHDPGRTVDSLQAPVPAIPASRSEVERRAARLDLGPDGRSPGALADGFIQHFEQNLGDLPQWISPVVQFRIDSEHSVWIGVEEGFRGDLTWYRRRSGEDRWIRAELERPVWRLIDARADWVAGILRDDLRVQTLAVFERANGDH